MIPAGSSNAPVFQKIFPFYIHYKPVALIMARLAPYANDHRDTNGPGDARPNALKIIRDQNLDGQLVGKIFLITGCTAGLGLETARALRATGADVYFTGRDVAKGKQVVESLSKYDRPGKIAFIEMHLDSLESVRAAAGNFLKQSGGKLNVLIANAGIRGYPKAQTKDGFEQHFGINHLGHFALFQELKDALIASSTPAFNSRVIVLTANGHRQSGIRFDDYHFDNRPEGYEPLLAYAQSKTANIYMAFEIDRRYGAKGLHALAVHPGYIATTSLNRTTSPEDFAQIVQNPAIAAKLKSAEQGAATTVWAAVAREWEGKGEKFLEDCQEGEPCRDDHLRLAPGYAPHIYDFKSAARLWQESMRMVGLLP
ncbi:uncharacterized protein PV06_05411 [Exophiala oligosperma]|uniref:Uncharacterized protein n=1 Tax=Exophiala oligosperma TaxID=215243 RepID=A0A0D2DFE6_9EURO|nr:uncharacterized protein PV06_05411 [Exophiala oligosperma]KIW41798.1 hypothetical protein PV06_05411 [Exophiala oligosperma]